MISLPHHAISTHHHTHTTIVSSNQNGYRNHIHTYWHYMPTVFIFHWESVLIIVSASMWQNQGQKSPPRGWVLKSQEVWWQIDSSRATLYLSDFLLNVLPVWWEGLYDFNGLTFCLQLYSLHGISLAFKMCILWPWSIFTMVKFKRKPAAMQILQGRWLVKWCSYTYLF